MATVPAQPGVARTHVGISPAAADVPRLPTALLSATVFLGAFLLFLIEPLFAKLILPRFGGSAAVWATCLVFFQSALLLGYLYADVTTRRLSPVRQSVLHIALLLVSLLFLPIAPHSPLYRQYGSDPTWPILALLTASIGLPFLLLSATGPLVQGWYARDRSDSGPYHLFALSNFASLLALLSFPLVIEPRITSHVQAQLWSAIFAVFVCVCSILAWMAPRSTGVRVAPAANTSDTNKSPALGARLLWLSLSACGSMLLLSITNHLTENAAPVPLLWVLPLALYLLTFTLAFNRRSLYSRWLMVRLLAVALGSLGYAIYDSSLTESIQVSVPLFCIGLFLCCFFCHGELAKRRPPAGHLTSFYLMISFGGALGAVFVGVLAPHIFSAIYEFPLALLLVTLLAIAVLWPQGWLARAFWAAAALAMVFVLVRNVGSYQQGTIVTVRNFYGALRVKEHRNWLKEPYRELYNGKIEHGAQFVNQPQSLQPTTYYSSDSGIGLALDRCCGGPKRVGMIGLGAGTVAAYGKPGDYFRFYEINPQVVTIARDSFSYLRDTQAKTDIAMGDARLSLESEPPLQFDVFGVDAFSGDAIPVHLLTKEAFALYLRHLKPEGILAIHTSNTYLDLAPVVQLLANDAGYPLRLVTTDDNLRKLIDTSDWVLISRNQRFFEDLDTSVFSEPITVRPPLRLWTDDFNNLFQILKPVKIIKRNSD